MLSELPEHDLLESFPPNVLVGIHGTHKQPKHMESQRETWLKDLPVDYKFFLGYPALDAEDVVSLDMPDGPLWISYVNGPRTMVQNLKTEALAKYAYENGYDYVFKCDDDTYAWPDRLLTSGYEQYDYSGFVENRHYAQDIGFYGWCQGGAGYWLSRRAMKVIIDQGARLVPAEDFAVAQTLARHGIHPHHDPRYIPGVKPNDLLHPSSDVLTMHKVTPEWMYRLHGNS